jgi:biotin carboxyl carrier protein
MRWWVERDGRRVEVSARRLDGAWEVTVDGTSHVVEMLPVHAGLDALFWPDGRNFAVASQRLGRDHWRVSLAQLQFEVRLRGPLEREAGGAAAHAGPHEVRAPIPGRVVSVSVMEGDQVKAGQALVVLEAMKMENELRAPKKGKVTVVAVAKGDTAQRGQLLVGIE